ncbi:hypothetical protein [Kribbella sp. NPDC004875]|uniref:hypothetical protein n=1 Tax=Kribbella sp. NPDC004875 TaxID=3364107 RepID=UPI0036C08C3E
MADLDPDVLNLVHRINQLVARDSRGRSAGPSDRVLEAASGHHQALGALARNLDLPVKLASSPQVDLTRGARQVVDRREDVRAALTAVVAACASSLDARIPPPPTTDPARRERLTTAIGQAYAATATQRIVPGLLTNGRPDDLGSFPHTILEGDAAAARALALAVGARIDQNDERVLKALVGAGAGCAGRAAAGLLLYRNEDYMTLPAGKQREVFADNFSDELETRFGARDLGEARVRALTEEIESRWGDIAGGAGAVDGANARVVAEIRELHEFFDQLPDWHEAKQTRDANRASAQARPAPVESAQVESAQVESAPVGSAPVGSRPGSVGELIGGMRGSVGELTGAPESLWNGEYALAPIGGAWDEVFVSHDADGTLYLNRDRAETPLRQLTADGPAVLTDEQVVEARTAMQSLTATLSWQAVPEGYTRADELRAQAAIPPETTHAVGLAFSEDNLDRVIEQTLPSDVAARLTGQAVPFVDSERAPAARAFARGIDDVTGRDAGETLRQLAGQHRAAIATTAADVLTAHARIPSEQRPAIARDVAARVDAAFGMLPAQVQAWREAGTAEGDIAGRSREFGQGLAREVHELVWARQDPAARFVPGLDPTSARSGAVQAPADTQPASQATGSGPYKPRGMEK